MGELSPEEYRRIHALPMFGAVAPESLTQALTHCQVLRLGHGELLLHQGQYNRRIFLLLNGEASVHLSSETNAEPISIHPGECIGELSAIDGEPVSAAVHCERACRFLSIEREVFWHEFAPLPGVLEAVLRGLSGRLRNANRLALQAQRRSLELAHLEKEMDAARKLQNSLLPLASPLLPAGHRLRAATRMRSASAVSGDLFDLIPLEGNRVFVCIGDVTGHGLGAALFMARTIGLLRLLAHQIEAPGELLTNLNNRLCDGPGDGHFVTLFCGVLNSDTGHIVYANAGHCPPLIMSGNRNTPITVPAGVLLGAFPDIPYAQMTMRLTPGEGLFLYTDGLTEAENRRGESFGLEHCQQFPPNTALDDWLDQLLRAWTDFTKTDPPADDCALLALQWTG